MSLNALHVSFGLGWLSTFYVQEDFLNKANILGKSLLTQKQSSIRVLLKKTLAQVFSCEFCEFFKNNFLHRTHPVAASTNSLVQNQLYIAVWKIFMKLHGKCSWRFYCLIWIAQPTDLVKLDSTMIIILGITRNFLANFKNNSTWLLTLIRKSKITKLDVTYY